MQRSALCRSRRALSNAYLIAKFGFGTAENEPCQVRQDDAERQTAEVVHAYEPRSVVEKPLPEGWEDPNFFHHGGHKVRKLRSRM